MSAECYWCSTGDDDLQNAALGTCSDCWVFACHEHAERDANVGKWKCFDGVAKLLATAAGLEDPEEVEDPPIADPQELALRFPRIASQTEAERAHWSHRSDDLLRAVEQAAPDRVATMLQRDPAMTLLGHAVGIGRHFLRGPSIDAAGEGPRMSGRLGRVVEAV